MGDTRQFTGKEKLEAAKIIEIADYVRLKENVEQLPQQFDTLWEKFYQTELTSQVGSGKKLHWPVR